MSEVKKRSAHTKHDLAYILALPEDAVLSVDDVATWFRVSAAWVRNHARSNSKTRRQPYLPGMKMGKYVQFRKGAVMQALLQWERERRDHAAA